MQDATPKVPKKQGDTVSKDYSAFFAKVGEMGKASELLQKDITGLPLEATSTAEKLQSLLNHMVDVKGNAVAIVSGLVLQPLKAFSSAVQTSVEKFNLKDAVATVVTKVDKSDWAKELLPLARSPAAKELLESLSSYDNAHRVAEVSVNAYNSFTLHEFFADNKGFGDVKDKVIMGRHMIGMANAIQRMFNSVPSELRAANVSMALAKVAKKGPMALPPSLLEMANAMASGSASAT